jgi:hypothetical protein
VGVLARLALAHACAVALVSWTFGCTSDGGVSAEPAAPTRTAAPARTPQPQSAPNAEAVLDATGLGRVKLGAPLPSDHAVAERYYTGYYADAQPLEGFALGSARILAIVEGGAFTAHGTEHPGQPAPDDVRARTLAAGAAGALVVRMIVVTDPAIATPSGVRVGTELSTFRRAFPLAPLRRVPPLWDDPSCLVEVADLAFFFDRCSNSDGEPAPPDAKVIRIVARR